MSQYYFHSDGQKYLPENYRYFTRIAELTPAQRSLFVSGYAGVLLAAPEEVTTAYYYALSLDRGARVQVYAVSIYTDAPATPQEESWAEFAARPGRKVLTPHALFPVHQWRVHEPYRAAVKRHSALYLQDVRGMPITPPAPY